MDSSIKTRYNYRINMIFNYINILFSTAKSILATARIHKPKVTHKLYKH